MMGRRHTPDLLSSTLLAYPFNAEPIRPRRKLPRKSSKNEQDGDSSATSKESVSDDAVFSSPSKRKSEFRGIKDRRSKNILFYRNGDKFYKGKKVRITPHRYLTFNELLNDLTKSVSLPYGVRRIYTPEGEVIENIDDLEDGKAYVCASFERFKQLKYGSTSLPDWTSNTNKPPGIESKFPVGRLSLGYSYPPTGKYAAAYSKATERMGGSVPGSFAYHRKKEGQDDGTVRTFGRPSDANAFKPRLVKFVKYGSRPRKTISILLNKRTVFSFEHLLNEVTDAFDLPTHKNLKVRKVYTTKGKEIRGVSDFFRETDSVFIAATSRQPLLKVEIEDILEEIFPSNPPPNLSSEAVKPKRKFRDKDSKSDSGVEIDITNHTPIKSASAELPPLKPQKYQIKDKIADSEKSSNVEPRIKAKAWASPKEREEDEKRIIAEEKRRKEDAAQRKKEEAERKAKEEELRKQEEEKERKKREDELQAELARKEAALKEKEEELRRKEEESKRKEEELKKKEDERKKKDEEKRKRREKRKQEEAAKKKEEEAKKKEEEAKKKEEEAKKKEEAVKKEEEEKRKEEEKRLEEEKKKEEEKRLEEEKRKEEEKKKKEKKRKDEEKKKKEKELKKQREEEEKKKKEEENSKQKVSVDKLTVKESVDDDDNDSRFDLPEEDSLALTIESEHISNVQTEEINQNHYVENNELETKTPEETKTDSSANKIDENRFAPAPREIVHKNVILEKYDVGKKIGDGNFAEVHKATLKRNNEAFAMKIVYKSKLKGKEHMIANEIGIMHNINHKNIVRLYEEYETKNHIYLLMEYVSGGDLFDAITESIKFTEADGAQIIGDMARALQYLHDLNIVHRDLKPENLLVSKSSSGDIMVKLADFGLAMEVKEPIFTVCGTPTYVAPEILAETGYGLEVDMWATGVITYILLCGFPPFRSLDRDQEELFELIQAGVFEYLSPYWDNISFDAKDLINHLLVVNPKRRFKAEQVLRHPWIVNHHKSDDLPNLQREVSMNLEMNFEGRKLSAKSRASNAEY